MRHFTAKNVLTFAILMALMAAAPGTVMGQDTPKKPSLWQQMKDAAKQAGQKPGQPPKPGQQQGSNSASQAGGPVNDSGPFQPPAGTNIEEKILAPLQQGASFEVSPHGLHVATIESDGSRAVVYYDGVEGPKFDEILEQDTSRIAFSPDGNRYAYCARSGDQYVVVVDGKELLRSSESQGGKCHGQSSHLGFTSNSKHVFYFAEMHVLNPADRTYQRWVFDGKPEIPNAEQGAVAFSPDGDHYAYIWNDINRQKPWMLIVDGKPAAYQGGAPVWTNDSKHLYTQRQVAGGGTDLLFDGKPIARAFSFKVYTAPVGDLVVVAVTGGTNFHPLSFLVVNGKRVPGSDTVERGSIDDVLFSADGKHYAALCGDISSHKYVITDGKRGQEYNAVSKLAFTPDSSTVVYAAIVNGRSFVVVGDKEFGAPIGGGGIPVLAPAGNRVAAFLRTDGNVQSLLLDLKVTPLNARAGEDLSFTPDGKHCVYIALDAGMGRRLVIDGVPQPQSVFNGDRTDLANVQALKYVLSADSRHVAHFSDSTNGTARGIFLDGKFVPGSLEGTNTQLVFSPDSKHLFWIHQYGDRPIRLFIDGKPLADFFPAGSLQVTHWWDFAPDGTLSILAQDDNSLKRITITPSSQTSLATLAGGETTLAGGN